MATKKKFKGLNALPDKTAEMNIMKDVHRAKVTASSNSTFVNVTKQIPVLKTYGAKSQQQPNQLKPSVNYSQNRKVPNRLTNLQTPTHQTPPKQMCINTPTNISRIPSNSNNPSQTLVGVQPRKIKSLPCKQQNFQSVGLPGKRIALSSNKPIISSNSRKSFTSPNTDKFNESYESSYRSSDEILQHTSLQRHTDHPLRLDEKIQEHSASQDIHSKNTIREIIRDELNKAMDKIIEHIDQKFSLMETQYRKDLKNEMREQKKNKVVKRPDFLPFKSIEELLSYDEADKETQDKLTEYLDYKKGRNAFDSANKFFKEVFGKEANVSPYLTWTGDEKKNIYALPNTSFALTCQEVMDSNKLVRDYDEFKQAMDAALKSMKERYRRYRKKNSQTKNSDTQLYTANRFKKQDDMNKQPNNVNVDQPDEDQDNSQAELYGDSDNIEYSDGQDQSNENNLLEEPSPSISPAYPGYGTSDPTYVEEITQEEEDWLKEMPECDGLVQPSPKRFKHDMSPMYMQSSDHLENYQM